MIEKHKSVFSLLIWSMRAYSVSWVVTFASSLINAIWMTYVFKFDFLSSIDGALANQIGIVLLNELYLLFSVVVGWKIFFEKSALFNLFIILLSAAFISLLIYAPIIAFNLFAELNHFVISGHSPLYDLIHSYSLQLLGFAKHLATANVNEVEAPLKALINKTAGAISIVVLVLALFLSFGHKAKTS